MTACLEAWLVPSQMPTWWFYTSAVLVGALPVALFVWWELWWKR